MIDCREAEPSVCRQDFHSLACHLILPKLLLNDFGSKLTSERSGFPTQMIMKFCFTHAAKSSHAEKSLLCTIVRAST